MANQVAWMEVQGLKVLQSQLKQLPEKAKRSTLLKIIRSTTGPVMKAAKNEAAMIESQAFAKYGRINTGNLEESIGNITGKSREYPNIQIGPRARGRFKGFHGHVVQFGTASRQTKRGWNRGAAKANPFMDRAFDKTLNQVRPNFEKQVARYTEKLAKDNIKPRY